MPYYIGNSSLIGTGFVDENTGVHDLQVSRHNPVGGGYLADFFTDTTPANITTATQTVGTYNYAFSSTYGLQTWGDAATGFVYTVQATPSYSTDILIQTSFYYGGTDNCPDPSIAIWPASAGRTSPLWAWSSSGTRIAAQNNCASYLAIYGTSTQSTGTSFTYASGSWYTMHFYHEPSLSRTRYFMTLRFEDWDQVGTQIGGTITLAAYYLNAVYVGLASDADGYAAGQNSCRFSALKITEL